MSGKLALVVVVDDGVRGIRDVVYLPDVTAVAFKLAINEGRVPDLRGYQAYTTHAFSHQALAEQFGIGRGNLTFKSDKGKNLLDTLRPYQAGVLAVYGESARKAIAEMEAAEAERRAAWKAKKAAEQANTETRWEQGAPTSL